MPQESSGRRSIRLQGVDYSQPGYYHVIIGTQHTRWFFGNVVEGEVCLNQVGQIAHEIWLSLPGRFAGVDLDHYIIMPNHVHGIVAIKEQPLTSNPNIANMPAKFQPYWHAQEEQQPPAGPIDLPEIVRAFKAATTHRVRREGNTPDFAWHSGYFEHIIGYNERALYNAQLYIVNNPIKWELNHRGWEAAGFKWARVKPKTGS